MGRAQKRKFVKAVKKKGLNKDVVEVLWQANGGNTFMPMLYEGDRVRINLNKIKSRPGYGRLSDKYREFVESHENTVFTVARDKKRTDRSTLVCLKEDPAGWLFWSGDLEKLVDPKE